MDDQGRPSKEQLLFAMLPLQQAATGLLLKAEMLKMQGDLPAAIEAYEQLISNSRAYLALAEQNNSLYPESPFDIPPLGNPILDALLTQADLLEIIGDRARAEAQREEAVILAEKYLPESQSAERQRQRASSMISQGRFNEALTMLASARDLARTSGNKVDVANITIDIAAVLEWLGDFERALAEVQTCLDEIQPFLSRQPPKIEDALAAIVEFRFGEADQTTKLFRIWVELKQVQARCNRYLGNLDLAERQFHEVMDLVPSQGRIGIDFQLAAILIAAGRFAEGLAALEKLEPLLQGLARYKLGALLSYQAEALLGLNQPQAALDILSRAIPELIQYQDHDVLWKAYDQQARAWAAQRQPAQAMAAYEKSIGIIDGLRKAPLGYRLDSTYLHNKIPVFEHAIDLACDRGEGKACCQFIEKVKSRGLTATLSIPRAEQPSTVTELDRQFDELNQQIDALEFTGYLEGWEKVEPQRHALLTQRAELLERFRIEDSRWRSLSEPVPFDLPRMLALLAERRQAALNLYYRPDQVVTVLLWDGSCTAARLPLSDRARTGLAEYVANLEMAKPVIENFDPAALGLSAADLVPPDLLNQALKADSLVVVPHGPLHLLPWAGLSHDRQRLFQHCPVGILPNLSCLPALTAAFAAAPRIALFGAPNYSKLPGVKPLMYGEEELITLQDIYQTQGGVIGKTPRLGKDATEVGFWELAKNPEGGGAILQVICHGNFEAGEPMHSGLLVCAGKIDAAEIARSHLPYDEVVLSACHTGHRPTAVGGVHLTGDDIVGLPGAFLEAGTRSVLVSIPPARDDVTLNFMTLYHEQRATGATPLAALQFAQKEMLQASRYPLNLWVGFTIYGYQ